MEWLNEFVGEYGALTLGGVVAFILSMKTFVFDVLSKKNVGELMNFAQLTKTEFNKLSKVVVDSLDEFKKEIKREVLDPLLKENKTFKDESQVLANLTIQLLSMVNVGVEKREATFNTLKKMSIITDEVKKGFEYSLKDETEKVVVQTEKNIDLKNKLKGL